jgi:fibrillarin-like rRNA methylase
LIDGNNKYKFLMNGSNGLLSLKPKSIDDAMEIEHSFKGKYRRVSVRFYG